MTTIQIKTKPIKAQNIRIQQLKYIKREDLYLSRAAGSTYGIAHNLRTWFGNSTVDFEAATSRGYTLHQGKENAGWFSCVRDSISIFGGGKVWLVGG
jgi:hypothetical protein